jgi:hypothetical protein
MAQALTVIHGVPEVWTLHDRDDVVSVCLTL